MMAIWTNVLQLQEANVAGGGRAHSRLPACCAPSPHLFVWLTFCSCSKPKAKHWSDHVVGVDREGTFCFICTSKVPDKWSNIRKSAHMCWVENLHTLRNIWLYAKPSWNDFMQFHSHLSLVSLDFNWWKSKIPLWSCLLITVTFPF